MAVGLQVLREDGSVLLDATKRFSRIAGELTLREDGSVTNVSLGYPNNKLWYVVISNVSPASEIENTPVIRIDQNGTRIHWQNQLGTIIKYGVY